MRLFFNIPKRISEEESKQIILNHNLSPIHNIWHYNYNLNHETLYHYNSPKGIVIYSKTQNKFAPAIIYCTEKYTPRLNINNAIIEDYNPGNRTKRKVFWFLRLTSFDDFLARRSQLSNKPKKHFPTIETYTKVKNKIAMEVKISDFNYDFFCATYNSLKTNESLTGEQIIEKLNRNNPNLPKNWLKQFYLGDNDNIFAVALVIDDGKSFSLENISSVRSSLGYGIYLCTELIRIGSENKYFSFDAGVSSLYGYYKDKIFLDSKEILNLLNKKSFSYLKKSIKKIIHKKENN